MCRHLGYLGAAKPVSDAITSGEHSLRTQAFAPTQMRGGGTINADGFGAAWWNGNTAHRYRSALPIWTDPAVDDVLSQVKSTSVIAAVRSATVGMPVERTACAPFTDGTWAFSHNGVVFGWPDVMISLVDDVPAEDLLRLEAPTDSAALWLVLRNLLRSMDPEAALRTLVDRVEAVSAAPRLNFLLGDGVSLFATTVYHSLSVLHYIDDAGDTHITLASEPTDDNPGWESIPDRRLVTASVGKVSITEL